VRGTLLLRVFAGYVVLAVALASIILVLAFSIVGSHYRQTLGAGLRNLGWSVALTAEPLLAEGRSDELNRLARDLGAKTDIRITIINADGVVLGDSDENPASMENHRTRPEVMGALEGEVGESTRLSTTMNRKMLYVAVPVRKDQTVLGVVRTSAYSGDITGTLHGMEKGVVGLAAVVVIICLAGALALSRSLTRPISRLSSAARKVGSGDLGATVILRGDKELRQLGESFNFMTERIRELVADLSRRREELASVISSIHDALVVIDAAGRISLVNRSFGEVVGSGEGPLRDITGKPFWEVLRAPEFGDLVKAASKGEGRVEREIAIGEKVYAATAGVLGSGGDAVVLFHDVTEMKDLERVKRDFVVNLSHELKTPLTAIKGFAETLEEEVDPEARGHVAVVIRHTDRLIAIVDDLLRLSELEDRAVPFVTNRVDLQPIVGDVLTMFDSRIKEKNLRVEFSADQGAHVVMGDAFKLEQVFVNLVDNAVKYTEQGTISVALADDGKRVKVTVADTGAGIAPEHLPRIFERFYVVDKSRSKKVGGTGLGLAIVKHIVLLHNGAIDVESTPGKGTKFTVSFPAAS